MLNLAQFEQLVGGQIPQKPMPLSSMGKKGEHTQAWLESLVHLNRDEQHRRLHAVLSELIVADITDESRLDILDQLSMSIERFVAGAHSDYVYSQNPTPAQLNQISQIRSLYYLLILAYQGVANRAYAHITNDPFVQTPKPTGNKLNNWLNKLSVNLSSNVVRAGVTLEAVGGKKRNFARATYRIMSGYFRLLIEFALTYERVPEWFWQEMNNWYLKAATEGVDKFDIAKFTKQSTDKSIYDSYIQACMASFANMFAYRRQDILNVFKILPKWTKYLKTSFVSSPEHKVFVNLQDSRSPEVITPQASINPYSKDVVCLFFDVAPLFSHLKSLEYQDPKTASKANLFESRLAKMVLLTFDRRNDVEYSHARRYQADLLVGFDAIFKELSCGMNFGQLISRSKLDALYHPKATTQSSIRPKTTVKMAAKSVSSVRFIYKHEEDVLPRTSPFLQVFGLFALRSCNSNNPHPWRVGVIKWVEHGESTIELDGLFLGRILAACGIRLFTNDLRSKDFVPAMLLSGDGLNEQSTLITPRYHFKVGDVVILRIHDKETTLRFEESLLVTDEIEQYRITRLVA